MPQRDINEMLSSSLKNLNLIIDSSKVIGTPLHIDNERVIIPLSKITFGFGVGGSEFNTKNGKIITNNLIENDYSYPFGGGTLGGVNISPIAFLLIDKNEYKIIRMEESESLFDKTLDLVINLINKKNKE